MSGHFCLLQTQSRHINKQLHKYLVVYLLIKHIRQQNLACCKSNHRTRMINKQVRNIYLCSCLLNICVSLLNIRVRPPVLAAATTAPLASCSPPSLLPVLHEKRRRIPIGALDRGVLDPGRLPKSTPSTGLK